MYGLLKYCSDFKSIHIFIKMNVRLDEAYRLRYYWTNWHQTLYTYSLILATWGVFIASFLNPYRCIKGGYCMNLVLAHENQILFCLNNVRLPFVKEKHFLEKMV